MTGPAMTGPERFALNVGQSVPLNLFVKSAHMRRQETVQLKSVAFKIGESRALV